MPYYSQLRRYMPDFNPRNVRTAYELGQAVGKKVKQGKRKEMTLQKQVGSSAVGSFISGASYQGKFNNPKNVKANKEDKYLSLGSGSITETYGQCSGNTVVWVGVTSLELVALCAAVAQATVRKLFKKAGVEITAPTIPFTTNLNNAQGFTVRVVRADFDGSKTTVDYISTANSSLVTASVGLRDIMTQYAKGADSRLPTEILLYLNNDSGDGGFRELAKLNLKNEIVHAYFKSKLVVQNRTLSAAAGTAITVNNDVQPLKGKVYYFVKGQPSVRVENGKATTPNTDSLLGRWGDGAVNLVQNEQTGYDADLKEPPSAYFFSNCKKTSFVRLEPGAMKEINVQNEVHMYMEKFIRHLCWKFSNNGRGRQNIGDSVYVCLEETMNSGSANKIKVQYECENNSMAYLTSGKIQPITKIFNEIEFSNVAG